MDAYPLSNAPFTILNYSGSRTGDATNLAISGGSANFRSVAFITDTPGLVTLAIDLLTRAWAGGDGDWDLGVFTKWIGGDQKFYQLDQVTFGNTGAATVALGLARSGSKITAPARLAKNSMSPMPSSGRPGVRSS